MMIGRIALSSKFPWLPAKATALSSPITWMQTMTIAARWVAPQDTLRYAQCSSG
jgi:hypothetical protein